MAIDLLNDKNYTGANLATKEAIFDKHIASLDDYKNANDATKNAIREKYGIGSIGVKPVAPVTQPKEEEGLFEKIFSISGMPTAVGGLATGIYNYFFTDEAGPNKVKNIIKNEQSQERKAVPPPPDINKKIQQDEELFNSVKTSVAFDFQKEGEQYDESSLNAETIKRLENLGYTREPFSKEDPTIVFKQNAPKLNPQQITDLRVKSAQAYEEKIQKLESEMPYAARFLPEGYYLDKLSGALSLTETTEEIQKRREEVKRLKLEKQITDQEYKSAQNFQSNIYTASENGVMTGFISSQIDPKEALVNPDQAISVIDNSYKKLFSDDKISIAKSSPEARDAYKKSLVEKSVMLNNEFPEKGIVELKAMEEEKSYTDVIAQSLGLKFLYPEEPTIDSGFDNTERFYRGYTSLDQQFHLSQQLKREKEPIIQSINQDKSYKEMYDEGIKQYLDNKKTGKSLVIDNKVLDEKWFNSALKASSALEKSIKKKEEDLNYLESIERTDTKEYRTFQENQRILNETGDKTRTTFAFLDSVKTILRAGEKLNDLLYLTLGVEDEKIKYRGTEISRKDIEAAKLYKPLRGIEQYYETIPEIGDISERVKSTELEAIRLFDEEGRFNPDIDLAGLAATSAHVVATSRLLGLSAVAEELTAGAFLEGLLGETAKVTLRSSAGQIASSMAKYGVKKASNITLGYVLPTNMLLGADAIKRYMEKGYNYDQAFSLSIIDNTIEGLTEVIAPNDALVVKNLILKGEIKTAKELADNDIYKGAFKKSYKAFTGKDLNERLYNTMKAVQGYGPAAWETTKMILEETGEEITGEALRSLAYKTGLTQKNPILDEPGNFTLANIANIAVSTMATMAISPGIGYFKQQVSQMNEAQNQYQYLVGKNVNPYVKATLDLYAKNEITEEESQRRLKAITEFNSLYQVSEAFAQSSKNYKSLKENEKESLKQLFFNDLSKKANLEKAILEAPTEEEKGKLIDLLEKTDIRLNDLKQGLYKSEEDRVQSNVQATNYFINESSVKSFSDVNKIDNLIKKYESYKNGETSEELIASYDNAIKLLNERKQEIVKKQEEEKKTPEQKAVESEKEGFVKIKDKRGVEKPYQIGKKYIVGRQIVFGKENPVRFPEVTFLGYERNEDGSIKKDEKGSPIVRVQTVDTNNNPITLVRPASVFEDFNLGSEEALNSTSAGRFYNKFKSKKFILSLKNERGKPNWIYNTLLKRTRGKIDLSDVNEVEGYLSAEMKDGKPVIYFNFVNPKTNQQLYYELSDKMIDFTQKSGGYLRPKPKTFISKRGQVITKTNQYEDLTPEEMEEFGMFTEKELEKYKEYVNKEDFSDLKNKRIEQEKRRRGYVADYIKSISKRLNDVVAEITKINADLPEYKKFIDSLNNIKSKLNIAKIQNIKLEDLKKVLSEEKIAEFEKLRSYYEKFDFLSKEVNSSLEEFSKKVEDASKKLEKLEEEKIIIQPFLDEEIAFLEEIDIEEFDYSESLVPQLKRRRESLQGAIKANDEIIKSSREKINSLQEIVDIAKNAIKELFSSLKRFLKPDGIIESNESLTETINNANDSINKLEQEVLDLKNKNKAISEQIRKYNDFIKFLEKLEAEYNKKSSGFLKEKIKEFLFAQQAPADENATGSNIEDKAVAREEDSARKYFEDLFHTSVSFGYKYEEELKDPKNNYANARLDFFFNNFKGSFENIVLVPINKKNAEKFGLTDILFKEQIDTDVKLVVARKTNDGYIFLDMNGNPIESENGKVSPNSVIYTSLQKPTLVDAEGKLKYNFRDFEFLKEAFPKEEERKAEIERIANEWLQEYTTFRKGIVDSENPPAFNITGISRGIPQYEEKGDQIQRNAVRGTLAPATTTSFKGKIQIADKAISPNSKLGSLIDQNGKAVNMPLGRPVYVDSKNRIFQFLDNHLFSKNQKETIIAVIKQMSADIIENYNNRQVDPSLPIVPAKYVNFLRGVVYWRNPSKNINNAPQEKGKIKDNQLWLDFEDGEAKLVIGGTNKISLKDLLLGDVVTEAILDKSYHNVYMKAFGKSFTEYYLENNELKERVWATYEDYLLSDQYPDGTTRAESEIPLTTSLIPNDSPFDENGLFKENYKPQYKSRYFSFDTPGWERVKVRNKVKEAKQTPVVASTSTPAPAKTSSKSANVVKIVDSIIQETLSLYTDEIRPKKEKTIQTWKNTIANLKNNTLYSFSLTSEKSIELNNGNPILFTFSVKIDENGNIKIEKFNSNITEDFNNVAVKTVSDFKITKELLEGFLNFLAYNTSDYQNEALSSYLLLSAFSISESPIFESTEEIEKIFEIKKEEKKPEEKYKAPVSDIERKPIIGETLTSDSNQNYKVRGFTDNSGVQWINTKDGSKGVWSKYKFDQYIKDGRLKYDAELSALEGQKEEVKPVETPKRKIQRGKQPPPAGGYRIAKGETKIKENIEKARQWVKEKFSNVDFSVVQGLVDGIAWGKFVDNAIILSESAEVGTVYHEAFEAVAAMFLNKRQWNEIVREFRSRKGSYIDRETGKVLRFSEATDTQIKEQLAEEYRDYEMSNGKASIPGQYKTNSLFRRIWNAIKALIFGDPKNIEDLFKKISSAEFKDKAPVKWNRPFNLEKSYRIANLQDDLFFYQLNKSLSLYALRNIFEKTKSFASIFKMGESEFREMYKEIRNQLRVDYFYAVNEDNQLLPITEFSKFKTIDQIFYNYDEFFEELIERFNDGETIPTVIYNIFVLNDNKSLSDEEYAAIAKNKIKDALLAYSYIEQNWEQVVQKNTPYLKKFGISYEGVLALGEDEEAQSIEDNEVEDEANGDSAGLTEQEKQESVGRDEYTKDPFSVTVKDRAPAKIKLLIATLPVAINTKNEKGETIAVEKLNDLGLPEVVNFSNAFRKVISTVIEKPSLLDQLKALDEASLLHPELRFLYKRLGGNKSIEEISKDEDLWNTRKSFNQTFNKQRFGFSRIIMKEEEKKIGDKKIVTLVSSLIDSLQSSSYKAIERRFVSQFKEVALKHPEWLDISTYNIPSSVMPAGQTRNPQDYIPYLEKIGFDIPYDINSLSKEERDNLFTTINNIATFLKQGSGKLEEARYFNFSKDVAELARIEYSVTKDAGEVQHRNIEGMAQTNDIDQNSMSIVFKALNAAKNLASFELDFPRFNDVYTKNALWRKLYFENGEKNELKLRVGSAEGLIETNGNGRHTSKLNYGQRILQEFIYNIVGDSKNFRSPSFYVITPADIKTEEVVTWGKPLVENNYIESKTALFDNFLKGYLVDEINLARELSQDDRGLKAYRSKVTLPDGRQIPLSKSLRFFHDILKFDYTTVIDNPEIDINEWINSNKEEILNNIDQYFDQEVQDIIDVFTSENIITLNPTTKKYDFLGMERNNLKSIDEIFGTNLEETLDKTGEVTISEQDLRKIIKYRSVNYFVNINEQSKLFFGDFGQFGDLTKRIKSFVSTRETTAFDNYSTNGEVYTKPAKALMNKIKYRDELGNLEEVEITEGVPGYQSFETTFKSSTIEDVYVVERSLPYIQEVHQESISSDLFFSDFASLPENLQKEVRKLASSFVKAFTEVNEADGQAYMALPLYRQFLDRSGMWNDDLQELYDYHMAYERSKRKQYDKYDNGEAIKEIDKKILQKGNPNEKRILEGKEPLVYPVIKPIGAGVRPGNKFITTLDKCSVAPLHYKLLEGKPSLEMYLSSIDQDVQYFRVRQAHKVGTPAKMQKAYNAEGIPNTIVQTDELSFQDYAIQVETRGLKDAITRGTQVLKLAFINLMESSVPVDFIKSTNKLFQDKINELKDSIKESFDYKEYISKWEILRNEIVSEAKKRWDSLTEEQKRSTSPIFEAVDDHNKVLSSLTNRYFNNVSKEFSIVENKDGSFTISDYSKFKEAIVKQLKDRNAAENLLRQLEIENGKFVQPFDFIIGADKLEPILMAIINKNVAAPKIKGKSLAQIATTFFEDKPRTWVRKIEKEDGTFSYEKVENPKSTEGLFLTSSNLIFYGDDIVEENGIPRLATEKEIKEGKSKKANFMEIMIPPVFKDAKGNFITDINKIDPELLKIAAYRIPAQEASAMENIRIKGFLPLEYQNGVVVPSSITAKAGSDFDIDKLNMYLYHYYTDLKTGLPKKIKFLDDSNSTAEERYKNYRRRNKEVAEIYKKYADDIAKIDTSLQKSWQIQTGQLNKMIEKKQLSEKEIEDLFYARKEKEIQLAFEKADVKEASLLLKDLEEGYKEDPASTDLMAQLAGYEGDMFNVLNQAALELEEKQNKVITIEGELESIENKIKGLSSEKFKKTDIQEKVKRRIKRQEQYLSEKQELLKQRTDEINLLVPDITFEEFSQLSIEDQNSQKALENRYIDTLLKLLSFEENKNRMLTPNSADTLKALAKYMEHLKKDVKKIKLNGSKSDQTFGKYGSALNNAYTRYSYQVGKEGVGIGAVAVTNHSVNQFVDSQIMDPSVNEISLYFPTNKQNDKISITFKRDAKGNWISNNISEIINGFVDIAKDPFIIKINGNLSTAGSYLIANKMGIPLDYVALIINQPAVELYENLVEKGTSSITKIKLKKAKIEDVYKYPLDMVTAKYGELSESYVPKMFTIENLEEMIRNQDNLTEEQKQDQLKIFEIYTRIKSLNNTLREEVNTYNFDTDLLKSITGVYSKLNNIANRSGDIEINTEGTFFQAIKNTVVNYTSAVQSLFEIFTAKYRNYVLPTISDISRERDKNRRELALADIKRGFANYLILTLANVPKEGLREDSLSSGAYGLQSKLNELMINTETSVITRLKILQDKMKDGKIPTNFALQEFFRLAKDAERKTNNLTVFNRSKDPEYIDLMVTSLKEMEDSTDPFVKKLAEDIYVLALLQSGLNQSFVSVSQYIPDSWFTPLAKNLLTTLDQMDQDVLDKHLKNFRPLYYANKWKDPKFTSRGKYRINPPSDISTGRTIISSFIPVATVNPAGEFEINTSQLSKYQLVRYTKEKDGKYKTNLFQRVEYDNGDPVLIRTEKGYSFIYREITPLGNGQYTLEFTSRSKINENVQEDTNASIIAKLVETQKDHISLSELMETKVSKKKSFIKTQPTAPRTIPTEDPNKPEFNKLPGKSTTPTMTYAGIGSRQTPPEILAQMTEVAKELEAKGFTLNTGVTFGGKEEGADEAFSKGATKKNLFAPEQAGEREMKIAKEIHPNWNALVEKGPGGPKLMARNTNQVFGENLDTPVDFVLFYAKETKGIRPEGGTGQAVEMARRKGIPTINMANPNWREQLNRVLSKPTTTEAPVTAEEIYSQLGNRTFSGNVTKEKWSVLEKETKAINPDYIVSTRIKNTENHFGNFYSSIDSSAVNTEISKMKEKGTYDNELKRVGGKERDLRIRILESRKLIPTETTQESVEKYINWILTGETGIVIYDTTTPEPTDLDFRREWILEQLESGNLQGKPIKYFTEIGEPSHATALDYLINKYDWSKPTTPTVSEGIEINSKQTGLGNDLTNVHYATNGKSKFDIKPSDTSLTLTPEAKKTWGESVEAWYKSNNAKSKGIPEGAEGDAYDMKLMIGLITDKLKQYPDLVTQITERGGLGFLDKSTHTMGTGRWSSKNPKNMFMNALKQAYRNVSTTPTVTTKAPTVIKTYSGKIESLKPNQIFVFGSNPEGRHGAGAAKTANDKFGAKYGNGRGLQGKSYALVTKNLKAGFIEKETGIKYEKAGERSVSKDQIVNNIKELYDTAIQNPNKEFLVAYSVDGKKNLNGYTDQEMADMFSSFPIPSNMVFEEGFSKLLKPQPTANVNAPEGLPPINRTNKNCQ